MITNDTHICLSGVIDGVTHKSAETPWAALRMKVDQKIHPQCPYVNRKGLLKIVGALGSLQVGDTVKVTGVINDHPQHGIQIQVNNYEVKESTSVAGLTAYLAGCIDQLGPVLARRIVKHFGLDALAILDESPNRLYEVEGIGRTRVANFVEKWPETRALRKIHIFLTKIGVNAKYAEVFLKIYGVDAVEILTADPYRLTQNVSGFGFVKADAVARKLGLTEVSPVRLRAALEHVLSESRNNNGDCFMYVPELIAQSLELLNNSIITKDMLESVMIESVSKELLIAEDNRIYLPRLHRAEMMGAKHLHRLLSHPVPPAIKDAEQLFYVALRSAPFELDDMQKQAIWRSLNSKVSVITGGPGTGKTALTRALVAGYDSAGIDVVLLAPTGRAAKRMEEVIGREAATVHRKLYQMASPDAKDVGNAEFHNCVIIVDEVSMVDIALLTWLLNCCHDNVVLILIGDADQLPSVGPGAVLRDLVLNPQVPATRLATIHRQATGSDIIVNAHRVNKGEMPRLTRFGKNWGIPDTDMFAVVNTEPDFLRQACVWCATEFARNQGYDPVSDCQVLSPMHRGSLGVQMLNRDLQMAINPSPADHFYRDKDQTVRWGIGDKLMQTKNDYDVGLMNGDVVIIQDLQWSDNHKIVTELTLDLCGLEIKVSGDKFKNLTLAYACTIHKSQGSQFPMLIMCLHTQHFTLLQRNLLYTGITRAEKCNVICCSEQAVEMAIRNNRIAKRNTWLSERLTDLCRQGV